VIISSLEGDLYVPIGIIGDFPVIISLKGDLYVPIGIIDASFGRIR
jgi:hypothetical protein